jgi:hypothetical protein
VCVGTSLGKLATAAGSFDFIIGHVRARHFFFEIMELIFPTSWNSW